MDLAYICCDDTAKASRRRSPALYLGEPRSSPVLGKRRRASLSLLCLDFFLLHHRDTAEIVGFFSRRRPKRQPQRGLMFTHVTSIECYGRRLASLAPISVATSSSPSPVAADFNSVLFLGPWPAQNPCLSLAKQRFCRCTSA